jgi:hypothetical protein
MERVHLAAKLDFPPPVVKDNWGLGAASRTRITHFKSASIFILTVFDVVRRFVVAIVREARSFGFQSFGFQFRLKRKTQCYWL